MEDNVQKSGIFTKPLPDKASKLTLFGYSIGFAPAAVLCYNAFYIYFMFFMTDIVHLSAATAGVISLIAIIWDAVSDPIIAYASDNCRWKGGRRIPFMTIGLFVMSLAFICIFTVFNVSDTMRVILFIFFTVVFWTGSTMYDIPHNALGSELVGKQSEREKLRLGTMIVDGIGLLFIVLVIPTLTESLTASTGDAPKAWQLTMLLIGVIACMIGVTSILILRGQAPKMNWEAYDRIKKEEGATEEKYGTMLKELFQLKPYSRLVAMVIIMNFANVCLMSSTVYFLTHICGYGASEQTTVLGVLYGTNLVWGIFIAVFLQNKLGGEVVFKGGVIVTILALVIFPNMLDVTKLPVMCFYGFFVAVGSRVLWLYCYIYAYRCAMLDDIKNSKHREGNIVGFMSLGLKAGSAIATFAIGIILEMFSYDGSAAVQSATALFGIRFVATILPAIMFAIGLVILFKYPMKQKDADAIEAAIIKRDAGEAYSTEEFEHLL